jgi:hypothetical protein
MGEILRLIDFALNLFETFQVDHLGELDHAEDDEEILCQGSYFRDRVFLSEIVERKLVCDLVTQGITVAEFLVSPEIQSENGVMLSQLVRHIDLRFNGQLPKEYARLLTNISKPTSVAGLLQCTGPEALKHLGDYSNQTLDLRHRNNRDKLDVVQKELPVFWQMLLGVLNIEKTNFMNPLLTNIVNKLLSIR